MILMTSFGLQYILTYIRIHIYDREYIYVTNIRSGFERRRRNSISKSAKFKMFIAYQSLVSWTKRFAYKNFSPKMRYIETNGIRDKSHSLLRLHKCWMTWAGNIQYHCWAKVLGLLNIKGSFIIEWQFIMAFLLFPFFQIVPHADTSILGKCFGFKLY